MQQNSPIKQRMLEVLENKGLSKYAFYKDSGMTRGVLDKKSGISEDNIAKFVAYFEDVNLVWLVTGAGEMYGKDKLQEVIDKADSSIPEKYRSKMGGNLGGNLGGNDQTEKTAPNIAPNNKKGDTAPEYEGRQNIILFDQKLAAGFPEIVTQPTEIGSLPRFTLPQLMFRMGTYYCFQIKGDSMHPTVKDKEWLITHSYNVPPSEVRGGRVYGVFTRDYGIDGALCKRLYHKKGEKSIKFVSDNETHAVYREPFENVLYIFEAVVRISDDFRNWNSDLRRDIDSLRTRMMNIERRLPE